MNKVIRIIASVVCLAVFVVSAIKIVTYFVEQKESKDLYSNMATQAVTVTDTDSQTESVNQELEINFDSLVGEYKDITGWIYSPNTKINYPVVKSKDNNEYLKMMPNGKYNPAGSIFADCRNGNLGDERNYIIYGHNMKNDTMFGSLSEYKKQSFYDAHPVIYYITPEKKYTLKIFAGFVTSASSDCYIIDHTEESLAEYMANIKQKSTFKSDCVYNQGHNIVTLSTCSSDYDDARYVLVAIVN